MTEPVAWHTLTAAESARRFAVTPAHGLADSEVTQRRAQHGENRLREKPPRSRWLLYIDQFRSLLIGVLLFAAVLAGIIGDLKDALVILIVVLFNALLGFWQERRAEATLAALKQMLARRARVRRDGNPGEIPAEDLVPGDLVLLEAGDRVPADGRLVVTHNVEIDEATLTGESHPTAKNAAILCADPAPLAERFNCAFMNTVVTRGRAELLVTATGMTTEIGRLTGLLEEVEEAPTPLQIQLDHLGKRLALIAGVVVTGVFALGLMRHQSWMDVAITSIALAVAAIPEGLPAVVTVTLAIGMHRMAQQRAIVKKLAAVETLGCTTTICSDKTGTLTLNQMTARAVFYQGRRFQVSGEGYTDTGLIQAMEGVVPDLTPLALPAALANDSRIHHDALIGDPTEGALLALAKKAGVDDDDARARWPRIAEIPFDSAHKFMASFHHDGAMVRLYVKGAPDVLLARCTQWLGSAGPAPLSDQSRSALTIANDTLAGEAMRVLAVASKDIPAVDFSPDHDLFAHARDLTFVGLIGLIDPPRPEARDAIELCRDAGITVKMITGDHKLTAAAIANELGLIGDVVTGAELDACSDEELTARIEKIAVFARVAPEHKVRIVRALKQRGQIVAMTGDGVNDAPALKNADIGIAMGITGSAVTKEAATMVLVDDNFATLVGAVREGRTLYENIIKFVRFQLSTNIGAIFTVSAASLLGLPTPFTALQILWINIIMDGPPAMTLGVEPTRPGIMREPPRQVSMPILTGQRLARLVLYGMTMAAGTLLAFKHGLTHNLPYALTLAFTTFVLFQFFNVFNARAETGSAFNRQFFANGKLWLALTLVIGLQMLVVYWEPAQTVFGTTALDTHDWLFAVALASSVLLFDEAWKFIRRIARGGGR